MPVISKITGAPFRFWCQKVLPAVYDDSLSYYELLCKVVDYLNKVMEDDINVVNLVNELEEFVNNYFDNLDVQEEINNKLDAMAEDGSLLAVVAPHLDEIIADYEATLDADLVEYKGTIDADITAFKRTVNNALDTQDTDISNFKNIVNGQVSTQNTEIANFKSTVNTTVATQDNDISVMQSQMNNFIQNHSGELTFTELYSTTEALGAHTVNETFTLSDDYTKYPELDIYWSYNSVQRCTRVKTSDVLATGVEISFYADEAVSVTNVAPMFFPFMKIVNGNTEHTQLKIDSAYSERWSGASADSASRSIPTSAADYSAGSIIKVVGVSYQDSAELQDIRVGYNGAIYASAGNSVRSQVSELHNVINNLAENGNLENNIIFEWQAGEIKSDGTIVESDSYVYTQLLTDVEYYSMVYTAQNDIEVYAYNADNTFYGRRGNLTAGVDKTPASGSLANGKKVRLQTSVERSANVFAHTSQTTLISDVTSYTVDSTNKITTLSQNEGYIDLTNKLHIGALSSLGAIETNNGRLYTDEIELTGNNVQYIVYNDDYTIYPCYYKPDHTFWSNGGHETVTSDTLDSFTQSAQYLLLVKYVRFMFKPKNVVDYTISGIPNTITGSFIRVYPTVKTPLKLNILSYNLRCLRGFSGATPDSAPLTDSEIKNCIETMSNYIGSYEPDLFIACEDRQWFDAPNASDFSGGTKSVYNMLWSHWFPYKYDLEYGISIPRLYSKYPLIYARQQPVTYPSTPQSNRPFNANLIVVNNIPIWVIPVHATSDPSAYSTDRQPYFQAIVDFCSDKEYVIIAGDFNTDTDDPAQELAVFVNAGFTLGNQGIFGDKKTYISGEGYTKNRLDNIIVKGITINNFIVGTEEYSDHYPVFSNVNLR